MSLLGAKRTNYRARSERARSLVVGYDRPANASTRALVVNEAETVRLIFAKYLQLNSANALERWLHDDDIRSKVERMVTGNCRGSRSN